MNHTLDLGITFDSIKPSPALEARMSALRRSTASTMDLREMTATRVTAPRDGDLFSDVDDGD